MRLVAHACCGREPAPPPEPHPRDAGSDNLVKVSTRCVLPRTHAPLRTSILAYALVHVCRLHSACRTLAPSPSLMANNMPCSFATDASDGGPVNIMETRSRRRMLTHTRSAKCCALNSESHSPELCVVHLRGVGRVGWGWEKVWAGDWVGECGNG